MFLGGPTTCTCDDCCGVAASSAPAITIRPHFDAELHNLIANHAEVRPTFGYHVGPTDLSPIFAEPHNYVLLSDGKGAAGIFEWSAPGCWQGHSIFLPESRGKYGIAAARAMFRWMFDEMGAVMIWGLTPVEHRAAHVFNRLIGMSRGEERHDGAGHLCRVWTLRERP